MQGLANAVDKSIYTDEKMNPKDIVSTTYLYDVIEYAGIAVDEQYIATGYEQKKVDGWYIVSKKGE